MVNDLENSGQFEVRFGKDIEARNKWLEQVLNPDQHLPDAEAVILDSTMQRCAPILELKTSSYSNAGSIYTFVDGAEMGSIVFGLDEKLPDKLIVTSSGVLTQGQGHGRRLYLEALKALPAGYGMNSHSILSPGAQEAWLWMTGVGVAHQVHGRTPEGQIGIFETIF